MRVSVLVAARNAAAGIQELLDLLAAQTLPREDYEVLVVDDCSTDDTAAVVDRHPIATLLRTPRRGGSYAARNVGLAAAMGDVVAITDADCRPAADWLERGLAALESEGVDLVGGHVEVPLSEEPTLAEAVDAARFLHTERAVRESGYAPTANLFVRRHVFETIGPFRGEFLSGGDVDFSERAREAAFTIAYAADAVVSHEPRRTARALMRKAFRVGFGAAQMRRWSVNPLRASPRPFWLRVAVYRFDQALLDVDRLARAGYPLSPRRLRRLQAAHYALVQLPLIAGHMVADARRGRSPR